WEPVTPNSGRRTADNRIGRHVLGHDSACPDDGAVSYRNATQDVDVVPHPYVVADDDGFLLHRLIGQFLQIAVFLDVIEPAGMKLEPVGAQPACRVVVRVDGNPLSDAAERSDGAALGNGPLVEARVLPASRILDPRPPCEVKRAFRCGADNPGTLKET